MPETGFIATASAAAAATDARWGQVFSQRQQREVLRTWKIKLISSQLAGGLTTG